jgi:hypothetical protein
MLKKFEKLYYTPTISGLIENQQMQYALARIHSNRHISRCLIFADWYCKELHLEQFNNLHLYFAVCFHDMGRKTEGIDHSTVGSIQSAVKYMGLLGIEPEIIFETCRIIENKDKEQGQSIYEMVLHDVDCLDIMRPSTGRGGIGGFDRSYLKLFRNFTGKQEAFISSAWKLISLTEDYSYENNNCLNLMINNIDSIWKNEFC